MRILIVRHGEAVDPYAAESDGQRWLTEHGRRTMRDVGKVLLASEVRFDRMFVSPLVRAVQTAEILAGEAGFEGPLTVWAPLAGGTTAHALGSLDQVDHEDATVALVGHEPLARAMAAHLTGTPDYPGFRTGGICVAKIGATGVGTFSWGIDPKALKRVERIADLPR